MIRRSGALALLLAVAATAPAAAKPKPISVKVRIEGIHHTLFDGKVRVGVRKVDSGDGTGKHTCDGTNGGASKTPGPTLVGAFDKAVTKAGLTWRGGWSDDFQDFTIDRVGPDASDNTAHKYWGQVLNYKDTQVGGCQQQLKTGDDVLVAFNSYNHPKLKLKGPHRVTEDKPFQVTVTDGATGKPVEGARVRGHSTDAHGHVMVTLPHAHTYGLKATSDGAIRSRALEIHARAA